MKKLITLGLLMILAGLVLIRKDDIITIFNTYLSPNTNVELGEKNEYYRDYDFKFVQNTDNFSPSNYQDLLNIYYTVINSGTDLFTFYCDTEYEDCLDDVSSISNDQKFLSEINNFVHPYNSFKTISFSYNDKGNFSLIIEHIYNDEEITSINYIVENKVNEIISEDMTTEEKIKKIHNFIIDSTKYDTLKTENIKDDTYKSNTAYGVLIQGYGICSGYSDTMSIFLNALDIENYKISNDTHIWNLVHINGVWRHLDTTWDDPISDKNLNRDTYFLISYDDLNKLEDKTHNFNKSIYKEAY
jgi:hypothetical protein